MVINLAIGYWLPILLSSEPHSWAPPISMWGGWGESMLHRPILCWWRDRYYTHCTRIGNRAFIMGPMCVHCYKAIFCKTSVCWSLLSNKSYGWLKNDILYYIYDRKDISEMKNKLCKMIRHMLVSQQNLGLSNVHDNKKILLIIDIVLGLEWQVLLGLHTYYM